MAVIRGEIRPDREFPAEHRAYHADRNAVHDYGSPIDGPGSYGDKRLDETVEELSRDPKTYRLRVARYVLAEVIEVDCVGKRPESVCRAS